MCHGLRFFAVVIALAVLFCPTGVSAKTQISISSYPPGAQVWIDGVNTGKVTPFSMAMTEGNHTVRLTAGANWQDYGPTVFAIAAGSNTLFVTLVPILTEGPQGPPGPTGPTGPGLSGTNLSGTVKYCSPTNAMDASDTMVYVPGKSFMALTSRSGDFSLFNLPVSVSEIAINDLSNKKYVYGGIVLQEGTTMTLGTLTLCCDGSVYPDCLCPDGTQKSGLECVPLASCTPSESRDFDLCANQCSNMSCVARCILNGSFSSQCSGALQPLGNCVAQNCSDFTSLHACAQQYCPDQYMDVYGYLPPQCSDGQTRACGSAVGACTQGTQSCVNGQWAGCVGGTQPVQEVCNNLDDDCNGVVDENPAGVNEPCSYNGTEGHTECQNGNIVCMAGISCAPPLEECNGDCVDFGQDPNHCGSCGNVCNYANAIPVCDGGVCEVYACNDGYADCDYSDATGCETHIASDPDHCGACGNPCAVANGIAGCVNSSCTVASCQADYADCNGIFADGCEVYLVWDQDNCGSCGTGCTMSQICLEGICVEN